MFIQFRGWYFDCRAFKFGRRSIPHPNPPPIRGVNANEPPVLHLSGVSYIAIPHVQLDGLQSPGKGRDLPAIGPNEYKPVIVVSVDCNSSSVSIKKVIDSFSSRATEDDVFSDAFLTDTVIFQGSIKYLERVQEELMIFSTRFTDKWTEAKAWAPKTFLSVKPSVGAIPSGPYFLGQESNLFQAWRLYPDTQGSFISSLVPIQDVEHPFRPLGLSLGGSIHKAVAVPSRLYSKKSDSTPLAGLRFSVKDNYKIAGMATTQSNKAWCELYQGHPENVTAAYVKKLISLGAVLVGKTVMCSFASSEEATDQWIDFQAPFNPRGDGYQSPSGSTTGGGTSLAAYDWLDCSIGTDTTGSIRWPAAWAGLYGLRTTWTHDAMEDASDFTSRFMDTIGILSKSINDMENIVGETITTKKNTQGEKLWPTEILYPTDFFPMADAKQQKLVDDFLKYLESSLPGNTTAIKMSIADRWEKCPPPEANGKPIVEYLEKTAYNPFYYDGYHEYESFRQEYKARFGKQVYVGPYMKWKWERGSEVTKEMKETSLQEVEVYRRWFRDNVLKPTEGGGTTAIMLIPCGSSTPKYRDEPNKAPGPVGAYSWNYIASVQGLPQLVVPIGSIPYESRISKRTEQLPVVGTILGAAGSDKLLVQIVRKALQNANWPTHVETGREMFKQTSESYSVPGKLI
ncbi:amidase signature enzyme [Apiospora saccharicola]|uniref:Amidase signature enzyme n=1 Tax=Apiospora saccharicola TaxID=335842 RepID=A0ABR1UKH2_9PEZI